MEYQNEYEMKLNEIEIKIITFYFVYNFSVNEINQILTNINTNDIINIISKNNNEFNLLNTKPNLFILY